MLEDGTLRKQQSRACQVPHDMGLRKHSLGGSVCPAKMLPPLISSFPERRVESIRSVDTHSHKP